MIVVLGVLGIAAYHLLLSYGQQTVSAGAAGVLSNTSPIFTALLAAVFLGEHLRAIGWVGIALAFIGAGMIATGGNETFRVGFGAAFVLLAACAWSLYFIGQKKLLATYAATDLMTYVIWSGTLVMAFFAPATVAAVRSAAIEATLAAIYLGTFPTVVAYIAWAYVLARLPVPIAASALYATPVLAMVLAWLLLGEVPSVTMIVGAVVAISGVVLVNTFGRRSD